MLERDLEARFRKRIRAAGGMVIKLAPMQAGVPDRLVLMAGRMHLVELKTETGRLSAIQIHWHQRAAAIGVTVVTLSGLAEVDQWIERNQT